MNKLLILTSCTKFEVNSLRNNGIAIKLQLQTFLAVVTQSDVVFKQYLRRHELFF